MTAVDLRILGFVFPPHLKPRVWLSMKPIHPGYVPWTDFLTWPHPDPINTLSLFLTLVAFPRPNPCLHQWADGPASLSCCLTGAVGQALAGHALLCPALPRKTLQLPVPWDAREQPAHMCLALAKLPSLKTLSVNQICGGNKSKNQSLVFGFFGLVY